MKKSHLFLKNEPGISLKFNRTRGRDSKENVSEEEKNYCRQRENFAHCRTQFEQELEKRHQARSREISVEHLDMLSIDFLKIADRELIENYCRSYGLSDLVYSNMNQTVLFAISDRERFNDAFMTQIGAFIAENNNAGTNYKVLTLMAGFSYWSSEAMDPFGTAKGDADDVLLELTESSARTANKHQAIVKEMETYLDSKKIAYTQIETGVLYQLKFISKEDLEVLLDNFDIIHRIQSLYMTRVQRERFTDLMEYERVKDVYILHNKMLEHTRPNLRILHPLPRVNEIAYDVDSNPKAYYFQQAQNGLYAREAILCDVLGITLDEVKADTERLMNF